MEKQPKPVSRHETSTFRNVDVGLPKRHGSVKAVAGGWDVLAGGVDIWERSDQFHFVFKPIQGDFDIGMRIQSFKAAHLYSKAGLMLRETLAHDSPHLMFLVFSNDSPRNNNLGAYEMQFRSVAGGDCQAIYPAVRPPAPPEFPATFPHMWLRVQRRGECFTALVSTDGRNWKGYGRHTLKLTSTLLVGPAVTSHEAEETAEVGFRDYTSFLPPESEQVPDETVGNGWASSCVRSPLSEVRG